MSLMDTREHYMCSHCVALDDHIHYKLKTDSCLWGISHRFFHSIIIIFQVSMTAHESQGFVPSCRCGSDCQICVSRSASFHPHQLFG